MTHPRKTSRDDATGTTILNITSPSEDTVSQLTTLQARLDDFKDRLLARSDWHPPSPPPSVPTPAILDITDLSSAVDLLDQVITHSDPSHRLTPHPSFTAHPWTWDATWKEFYTFVPDQQTFVFLSRWRLNAVRGVWEHVSMAGRVGLAPDEAAQMLGAWEDWQWDPAWGEWCLDVSAEEQDADGAGARCCVYASRWQVQADGGWVYVGRAGLVEG
jgi:hypothetical protein